MAMLATFRNAAGSSRATYTPWVTSSAAAAAGGAVEDGTGAASFATPSIASLSFIPSHDVAAECPVPARAWGHKPDRATTKTSSAAATTGFRSFKDEGDPPCSPSAYPNAFGGASHGSALANSQATRAVLYGGGGVGNFDTQQQQQWNGQLLEAQRQPHRALAMATPGPIATGSGVFGDHLSSSNRYSFDALSSSPTSRRFDPVAASAAAADIDGESWTGCGGGGGSGQQFPPASLQQQEQAGGAFVIRSPSIVASTRFSRMELGHNHHQQQQAMSQQWSHEELQRQMKEEHQLLQQSLSRQWHQQQHEQLQQQQQPAGFTRQLPSPSVALLLASSHDPDLLSSSPSTGPGLCPIPACDWRGADVSARGGGGGSGSTVRASRLSALQGGERNERGGEGLGQKGGDPGAINSGSNSSGNSCSGGSSNSSSSNSGSLGSGTWPPVGALAAQGARVLSKTGSSYLDGTGGSGSGSSGYSAAAMGNTSSRFFRQQQQQQQQQQQEEEDEQLQSRIPSLHQQQQLQLQQQQQAAGVRGSASGPMKLLRPHSAASGSGSNSSGLSSVAFHQSHLMRATSGPPPVEEDEWEEHMHMEEQDQVYHPSRLQHVYAGDSVQQGADCINWKDVEEMCASMDQAGVQLEDICLLCLPPGRSALAPSKASKEDILGGSSKAACESVLMKLRFRGMAMWHYPGDQTTKQLFQEVIHATSGAEA